MKSRCFNVSSVKRKHLGCCCTVHENRLLCYTIDSAAMIGTLGDMLQIVYIDRKLVCMSCILLCRRMSFCATETML